GTYSYRSNASYSGLDSFTYRAYDGATTSSIATVRITVIPVSTPPPPPRDTTKPVLSAPVVTLAARTGIHTAVFRSSEAGRATATVYRKRPGRLRNRRCIVPPRNPGSLPRCTRRVRVRIVIRSAVRSTNRVALGRLTPGFYDVDLVVRDAAQNTSRILRRAFVVRAPRVVRR
ncbi:MAG: Ig-like domain-containing protein, partial [Solirubrobacteraceae bacterium]